MTMQAHRLAAFNLEERRKRMIIVEGWVRFYSVTELDRLRTSAIEMMQAAKSTEASCLEYAYGINLAEPHLLRDIERVTDEAALTAHFAPNHRPYLYSLNIPCR